MNQKGSIEAGLMLAPLALLIAGMLQIGLMSHARDVLVSVASDAARATAISGDSRAGIEMVRARGSRALGGLAIQTVRIESETIGGTRAVVVELRAAMPLISIFGARGIKANGHAIAER
jgi:Flp pilus assembly protein TadG